QPEEMAALPEVVQGERQQEHRGGDGERVEDLLPIGREKTGVLGAGRRGPEQRHVFLATSSSIFLIRWSIGLRFESIGQPPTRPCASSGSTSPDRKTSGNAAVARSSRSLAAKLPPSMSGMSMSHTIRSGRRLRSRSSASWPLVAVTTT